MISMNVEEINLSGLLTTAPLFGISDANKKLSVNSNATGLLWTPEVVPTYTTSDADKKLTVNNTGSDLEWRADSVSAGYISARGDGSTNTESNAVGFVFENKLKSGLFNYTSGINDILALKIDDANVLECTPGRIYANQNINFMSDTLLSSQRINFGQGDCGISGDSSTNNQHAITLRTDNQERLRISTNENILCKSRIQIDTSLVTSINAPHIYSTNMFTPGISLDPVYGSILFSSSGSNLMAELNREYIDLREPVRLRHPIVPEIQIVEGTLVTANANLQGKHTYYMKRSAVTHSEINFPQPASGYNPRYEIITNANGVSVNTCRISTLSNDVIQLIAGVRTVTTGPVLINLTFNAHFIMQFIEADNSWLLIRTTQ